MKYVIIGTGAAGIAAADKISELDPKGELIIISTDEAVYSRCMLHHMISGSRNLEAISFIQEDFFESRGINWLKGRTVSSIDFNNQCVLLDDGISVAYDKLLIATGAKAFVPPVKGLVGAANVFTLRDVQDVEQIITAVKRASKVVVLGAGLVGLDVASALLEKELEVSVVEMADRLLPLQLDWQAAKHYEDAFAAAGAKLYTGLSAQEGLLTLEGLVEAIKLSNGTLLPCDLVVAAAGVRPNGTFLDPGSIQMDRGITVNDQMQTSVSNVYAAGDVTGLSAIWPNATKQGTVAAHNMTGHEKHYADYFTTKNAINLVGLETISIGLPEAPDDSYMTQRLCKDGVYKKIIHKNGIVYGVILQKDIAHSGFWTHVIKNKIPLKLSDCSPFSASYADFLSIDALGQFHYANSLI